MDMTIDRTLGNVSNPANLSAKELANLYSVDQENGIDQLLLNQAQANHLPEQQQSALQLLAIGAPTGQEVTGSSNPSNASNGANSNRANLTNGPSNRPDRFEHNSVFNDLDKLSRMVGKYKVFGGLDVEHWANVL